MELLNSQNSNLFENIINIHFIVFLFIQGVRLYTEITENKKGLNHFIRFLWQKDK